MPEKAGTYKQVAQKRTMLGQSEFPIFALRNALRIAEAIWESFAGKGAAPHEIAFAIGMSPTSGTWRNLCGSSVAYGITEGGYNANQIILTSLGRKIVAPSEEGENFSAKIEAILRPNIMRSFLVKYDKAKFPKDDIAKNVLISLGVPKDRADKALSLLKDNCEFASVVFDTKTGKFVALNSSSQRNPTRTADTSDSTEVDVSNVDGPPERPNGKATNASIGAEYPQRKVERVFITHGKNKKILDHIKEIVTFGKFIPVVAQEHETISKPVPDKVLEDMRSCQAAVIHVGSEGALADENGKLHPKINGNVLIEIGAAMALYGRKFILLVEDGVQLPSNLQGLYECRYQGEALDGAATMKLLKAFNDFGG